MSSNVQTRNANRFAYKRFAITFLFYNATALVSSSLANILMESFNTFGPIELVFAFLFGLALLSITLISSIAAILNTVSFLIDFYRYRH